MKRYLLFTGDFYYPSGGWGDFVNSFDTLEEAEVEGRARVSRDPSPNYPYGGFNDWWHIIDLETGARSTEGDRDDH